MTPYWQNADKWFIILSYTDFAKIWSWIHYAFPTLCVANSQGYLTISNLVIMFKLQYYIYFTSINIFLPSSYERGMQCFSLHPWHYVGYSERCISTYSTDEGIRENKVMNWMSASLHVCQEVLIFIMQIWCVVNWSKKWGSMYLKNKVTSNGKNRLVLPRRKTKIDK